jgi:hypothetical protein
MLFEYTDHAEDKILERKLLKKTIEEVVLKPDKVIPTAFNRKIAQRKMSNKLLRIVYEEEHEVYIIVTAYYTEANRYG